MWTSTGELISPDQFNKMRSILIPALLLFGSAVAHAQAPAVSVMNGQILKQNQSRVNAKDPALLPAYKQLIKDADKALQQGPFSVMEKKNLPPSGDKHDFMSLAPYHWPDPSKPDGLPYIRKDGQTNPEVKEYKDKEYLPKVCELVSTLSLGWYFSGDERYAAHAAKLLRVWFLDTATRMNPNLKYAQAIRGENDGRGAGLIDTRHFIKLLDAVGLLDGSNGWSKKDKKELQQWFAAYLNWMQTSKNGMSEMHAPNNHGTWYDAQRMSIALFIDSTGAAGRIFENAKTRLDQQMDEEGKFPKEMERTIALHYNLFDLDAFFLVASMGEKLGKDLWSYTSPSGRSLKKGFDFLHPFLTKEKQWEGMQIKDFDFEEGYPSLLAAAARLNCKKCREELRTLAGNDFEKLRWLLLSQ
jgi:hypothetical protein